MAQRADVAMEIERKFEMAASAAVDSLDASAVLGGVVPAEPQERLLEAVYFDTSDLRLLAEEVALRRRTGGDDAGWHLKLPVAVDWREEVRLPLTRAQAHPPDELAGLVRAFSRGRPMVPVAELRTHRRAWAARDGAGVLVAELVLDEVTGRFIGSDDKPNEKTVAWREVEVELGPAAPPRMLDEVEARLGALGLRRSTARSKVGRLLAGAQVDLAGGPFETMPRGSAGAVVVSYLRAQARAMHRCDPLVRLDREDAVHQMRVAARRMRSALQAFGRVLDVGRTRALTVELAWLAGELAAARDTEVMFARLQELLARSRDELVLGPVHADLTRVFARRRAEARARAIAALDAERYLALLSAVDALLADPPFTRQAGLKARRLLPREVRASYRRLDRAMVMAGRAPVGPDRDAALHEARKAAKRLRYATEAAAPVVGKPAHRLQRRLAAVQDLLGAHQDTAVTRATLRELAVTAVAEGGNGFTYGLMHAAEAERAHWAQQELPKMWARLSAPRVIGWLVA